MGKFMKQKICYLIILLLLCVLIFQCNKRIEIENIAKANNKTFTDSVTYYNNVLGTYTSSIRTLQLDNKLAKETLLKGDLKLNKLAREFSKLKWITTTKSNITFDTISTELEEDIAANDTIDFIRQGKISSEWYSLDYKITNDSLTIAPFKTWTETTVITGIKRKWFLGEQILITDVTNTNPYITITGIKSVEVIVPEPWYRKWYVWLAAGAAAGMLIK